MLEFLEKEQIDQGIIDGIREYREKYPAAPDMAGRVPRPRYHYYGKEVWEAAAAALLCGENLLLAGSKATARTCWRRTWPWPSAVRPGTCRSM